MAQAEFVALLLIAIHVVIVLVATVLISANRNPSSAIAWVLTIIFIPYIGLIAFLLIGFGRLPRRRRDQQKEVNALMLSRTPNEWRVDNRDTWPPLLASAARLNLELGALPMLGGNRAELIDSYVGSIDRMIEAIDTATEFVHVEFFILQLDATTAPFFDALRRATARGVAVKVLSDHASGFLGANRRETQDALRDMGAEWRAMLPLRPLRGQWQRPDLRNHRKLVVVDGRIGFTGSQNLVDATYNKKKNIARGLHWHELMMRVEGPVVAELDAVFITDWFSETDELLETFFAPPQPTRGAGTSIDAQVVPSGPSFENDNNLKLYTMLIHTAQRRLCITSPYFVPEASTLLAILTAAARGVHVELFVSEIGDQAGVYHAQRSYYEALLRAGVTIYLYRAPTVLHSKHFSIDDDVAVIGSSNMDIRSFSLNMEVSVLVHGTEFVERLREIEDDYRANSTPLDLAEWLKRPVLQRAFDSLARLTSSLQ